MEWSVTQTNKNKQFLGKFLVTKKAATVVFLVLLDTSSVHNQIIFVTRITYFLLSWSVKNVNQ